MSKASKGHRQKHSPTLDNRLYKIVLLVGTLKVKVTETLQGVQRLALQNKTVKRVQMINTKIHTKFFLTQQKKKPGLHENFLKWSTFFGGRIQSRFINCLSV